MRKSDLSRPLTAITFRCDPCRRDVNCAPERVEDAEDRPHHPWRYFATCTWCGAEMEQAGWERSLMKAWTKATGPRTPEGIAATAKNLEGHPTPEEARRTRFNAMKHGLSARTATYFPAKPDKYAFCASCDVDRLWCANQAACVQQTRNFLLHHAAFESRNPKLLAGTYSELQAAVLATVQQILQTIIADGVKLETPEWFTHEGGMVLAQYTDPETGEIRIIKNVEAHPLFKPLSELLTRANLSLSDMGMTMKVVDEDEAELGRIQKDRQQQEQLAEFAGSTSKSLAALEDLVRRSQERTRADPLLIEHAQEEGG